MGTLGITLPQATDVTVTKVYGEVIGSASFPVGATIYKVYAEVIGAYTYNPNVTVTLLGGESQSHIGAITAKSALALAGQYSLTRQVPSGSRLRWHSLASAALPTPVPSPRYRPWG